MTGEKKTEDASGKRREPRVEAACLEEEKTNANGEAVKQPIFPKFPHAGDTYMNPHPHVRQYAHEIAQLKKPGNNLPGPRPNKEPLISDLNVYLMMKRYRTTIRHLILIGIGLFYSAAGGYIFYYFEKDYEIEMQASNLEMITKKINELADDLRNRSETGDPELETHFKNAYISLLKLEGKYYQSTFHKLESEDNLMWTYGNAIFYAGMIFGSIGWGTMSPSYNLTRFLTLVYALITVPLTIVITRAIGQWVLVYVTKAYARAVFMYREARGYDVKDSDVISLPIKVCALLCFVYILISAALVTGYDACWGPNPISLFNSFYFMFMSLGTIGLGDYMPQNAPSSPVVIAICFFGLPVMRIVNRCAYIAIENGAFGIIALAEATIGRRAGQEQPQVQQKELPSVSGRLRSISETEKGGEGEEEEEAAEVRERSPSVNTIEGLTIHAIPTLMRNRADVYHGDFGRVNIRKRDLD